MVVNMNNFKLKNIQTIKNEVLACKECVPPIIDLLLIGSYNCNCSETKMDIDLVCVL
jgi:hypothetical protein